MAPKKADKKPAAKKPKATGDKKKKAAKKLETYKICASPAPLARPAARRRPHGPLACSAAGEPPRRRRCPAASRASGGERRGTER